MMFLSQELYPAARPLQPFWIWGLAFSEQSGPPPASGARGSWGAHLRAMSHGSLPSFPDQGEPQLSPVTEQLVYVEFLLNREALLSMLCMNSLFESSTGL